MQFIGNLFIALRQLHELDDLLFADGEFLIQRDFMLPVYPAPWADAPLATRPKIRPAPKTTLHGLRRKKTLTYWHMPPFLWSSARGNLGTILIALLVQAFRVFEVHAARILTR
jgi:hypothetical protein